MDKKCIKLNQEICNILSENDIPLDPNEVVNSDLGPETLYNIIIQTGPTIQENHVEDESLEKNEVFIQTVVECDIEEPFPLDHIDQFIKCNWILYQLMSSLFSIGIRSSKKD